MSSMKKFISSIIVFMSLFILSSCMNKEKIFVLEEDYNLVNEDLKVSFFINVYQSVYLKKENIANVYLKDDENIFLINLKEIIYKGKNNNMFQYDLLFDTSFIVDELLIMINPVLEIEYINQVIMSYSLGSLALFRGELNEDVRVKAIKGFFDPYLKGIILTLKNVNDETINLLDINLINAYFGADLANLKDISENYDSIYTVLDIYEPYKSETLLPMKLTIEANKSSTYFLPLCYINEIKGNQTAFLIKYQINNLVKEMGIKNFVFVNTEE